MSTRVEVIEHVYCDMHGDGEKEATEKREFALGRKHYTLDLCAVDARRFDRLLQPVVEVAQPVKQANGRRSRAGKMATNDQIREWAGKKGIKVAPKGRISQAVVEQFHAENG